MNRTILTFSLMLAVAPASALFAYDLHTKALTPVVEETKPAGGVQTLVKDGKLVFALVVNDTTLRSVHDRKAVEILTNAFARTVGEVPEIIKASETNRLASAGRLLVVADQPLARAAGVDASKLPPEGFAIRTFDRGVLIVGNDSLFRTPGRKRTKLDQDGASYGTVWGALDFCERFLGCRYFFPGEYGSHFPQVTDLAIQPVAYSDHPYVQWRGEPYFVYEAVQSEKWVDHYRPYLGELKLRDTDFARYLRIGGTTAASGMHSPRSERMAASHPDQLDLMFYKPPLGKRIYNPKDPEQCFYDVTNLKFADLLVDDWKEFFASEGKVDRGGFFPYVNNEYITFGQCDYMLALKDYVNNPTVRELGLVDADVIAKNRPMANVNARFFQYLARRVKEEFPGKKLNILAYYTSRYASLDPKWRLPDNVSVMLCPGSFPKRVRDPEHTANLLDSFREWSAACSGNKVSHVWLYTESTPYVAALTGEFTGETLKAIEPYFSRASVLHNSQGPRLWHHYWSVYATYRSQWNPDWDVEAGIDEHWDFFYGRAAGAHLRKFRRILKDAYLNEFIGRKLRVYPLATVDALEKELAAAGRCLVEGTPEWHRFKLLAEPWPRAFEQNRKALAYEPPYAEVPYFDKSDKAFWDKVRPVEAFGYAIDVKFAWDEDGLHYRSARFRQPSDIPTYRIAHLVNGNGKEREYRTDATEGLIPAKDFPKESFRMDEHFSANDGFLHLQGRGVLTSLAKRVETPAVTGRERVSVTYKEDDSPDDMSKAAMFLMTFQNDDNDYSLHFTNVKAHGRRDRHHRLDMQNGSSGYVGFGGAKDCIEVSVNGVAARTHYLARNAVSYFEKGDARGFSFPFFFDGVVVVMRFWMTPDSPCLFGELQLPKKSAVPIKSVSVRFNAVPSKLNVIKGKGSIWTGYDRAFVTAKRTLTLPEGTKPNQTYRHALEADEDWVVYCDRALDGSSDEKGHGPAFLRFDRGALEKAEAHLCDGWITRVECNVKPGAKSFRFLLWGNHMQRISNDEFLNKLKKEHERFEL